MKNVEDFDKAFKEFNITNQPISIVNVRIHIDFIETCDNRLMDL